MAELDVISEGGVDMLLEDLPDAFDNIFAVLACVDDPADCFFEVVACSFRFVEASFTVKVEHFLDYSQNLEQEVAFGESAGSSYWTFDAVEEDQSWVVDF